MRTIDDMVRSEVYYCVSSLVHTLAQGYGEPMQGDDLRTLTYAATELCYPIEDWEEAAIQEGWKRQPGGWTRQRAEGERAKPVVATAFEACQYDEIVEPYQREIFEHWIVSDWLADRLAEKGERIDRDFAGLTVWGRTTTGQGIACDWVIQEIHREMLANYGGLRI